MLLVVSVYSYLWLCVLLELRRNSEKAKDVSLLWRHPGPLFGPFAWALHQ